MEDSHQNISDIVIGEDLYGVSVSELSERIQALKAEILRIEAELSKKQNDLSAADQLFGKSS